MQSNKMERDASAVELKELERIYKSLPGSLKRGLQGAENALVLWAASLLALFLTASFVYWVTGLVTGNKPEISGDLLLIVILIAVVGCAIYAVVSSIKWIKSWPDIRKSVAKDLKSGRVIEETIEIDGVKRFQEQEHEGLIYFLRTSDNRILVFYDRESQDLAINGEDPFESKFEIRNTLKLVIAPTTKFFLTKQFSGNVLNAVDTLDLTAEPEKWPENESWCKIPWDKLEAKLSA